MARMVFGGTDQIDFFKQIKEKSRLNREDLGKLIGIGGRQYGDWSRGKFLPKKEAVEVLSKKFGVVIPQVIEIREEWWSGRINGREGGIKMMQQYGSFGTPEGRRRGGLVSQLRRRENPNYYRETGCLVANEFILPEKNNDLAEFVGIVLGDGGLQKRQFHITLNGEADKEYIIYVQKLAHRLFGYLPSKYQCKNSKAVTLTISGINLVDFLIKLGLKIGNKVRQQVDVPNWIKQNKEFSKFCLRGLMDTDGCIFVRKGAYKNKKYKHLNLYFSNSSQPLRVFAYETLKIFDFNPRCFGNNHVRLYSEKEVVRYLSVIGSSNYRLLRKLEV